MFPHVVLVDLPKVNGFAALNTTHSSVTLSWTLVAGVSGYLLTWRHISGQGEGERYTSVRSCLMGDLIRVTPCDRRVTFPGNNKLIFVPSVGD